MAPQACKSDLRASLNWMSMGGTRSNKALNSECGHTTYVADRDDGDDDRNSG